jgi:thiol-disulfide isomerase/thioredoxin
MATNVKSSEVVSRRSLLVGGAGAWLVQACADGGRGGSSRDRVSLPQAGTTVGGVVVGRPFPDLRVRDFDGRPVRVSAFRGAPVLVDVWATWCPPCKEELPLLDAMSDRLGKRAVVLAVSVDQDLDNVRLFLKQGRKWRLRFFHDPAGEVPERLQVRKMPTSYVLDDKGVLRLVNEGFERDDIGRIESTLRDLSG